MSTRLFLGYFLALAACTIFAFGTLGTGKAPNPDAAAAEQTQPSFPIHHHRLSVKHTQVARAG